jgi:hopene-associated glycosyltransferase HpnB
MPLLLACSCLALIGWLYLLIGHGWYWRTDQRLPPGTDPAPWPAVVAIVPARNEAALLPHTLPALLRQDYPGQFRVVLVDDESADGTDGAAIGLGEATPGRLSVMHGAPLPQGWAGKVWAMEQGLRAATDAGYLLFTDADIAYAPGTVTELVRAADANGLVMVSQMALLRADTFAERLLIPAFVYFFAQLYPFRRVNRRNSRTAAAAGGCMLVRRRALVAAGGLGKIRGARIDDVALGRLIKRNGGRCWLGFATGIRSRRRYDGLHEVWDMVARSAYTQLRYSPVALVGTVAGLAWLYLVPVAAAVIGAVMQDPWLAAPGAAAWALMSASYLPMLRLYRLSPLRAPALPLIAALYAAMTVSSARRYHRGRGTEWKGRA